MKKLINKVSVLLIALSLFACTEGDKVVDQVLNDTEIGGGVLRTLSIGSPIIETGVSTSKFAAVVEVQDVENSKATDKVDIFVKFKDNNLADGNNSKAEVLLKSIPASAFVQGSREFMNAAIDVTIAELKTKFSLTSSQYTGGDVFTVRLAQVLKNGKVYTSTNAAGTVTGGAFFSSPFEYTVPVVCPLSNASLFNGDYKVVVDAWQDYAIGQIIPVVYNPADGLYTFRILNTQNPYIYNPDTSYMICVVNPKTFEVKVTANEEFDYGPGYGATTGKGTVDSCTGDINVVLAFGPYGGYAFKLKKM
jgi:uncharacterized protein YsxB (DUF464 family)